MPICQMLEKIDILLTWMYFVLILLFNNKFGNFLLHIEIICVFSCFYANELCLQLSTSKVLRTEEWVVPMCVI